uniref:Uncharacterized protein n=1 Tax=Anguilla anguilla TaxID=7936 RepID=A0A0E9UIR5_ANGAN
MSLAPTGNNCERLIYIINLNWVQLKTRLETRQVRCRGLELVQTIFIFGKFPLGRINREQ